MALPAGALTATITVGAPIDIAGAAGTLVSLTVRPDVPAGLVWAADGTPIEPWSASPAAGEAPVTSASLEVLADQPGVLTSSTVDGAARMVEIRSWPLVATWVTGRSATGAPTRHVRRFNAPAAGETVDLDLLPADGVTVPATVTSAQTINIGGAGIDTEGVQDVVGAMIVGAGGTYDDAAGSITLPAGGGTTRGLIITDTNVAAIPDGDAIDNLAAYYNSGASAITVQGTSIAAGAHAVWAWVSGAWMLLASSGGTPPTEPAVPATPTVIVESTTTDSITVGYSSTTSGITAWQYRLNAGTAGALDGTTPDTLAGVTVSSGTVEVRCSVDGTTWSPWGSALYALQAATSGRYVRASDSVANPYATESGDLTTGYTYTAPAGAFAGLSAPDWLPLGASGAFEFEIVTAPTGGNFIESYLTSTVSFPEGQSNASLHSKTTRATATTWFADGPITNTGIPVAAGDILRLEYDATAKMLIAKVSKDARASWAQVGSYAYDGSSRPQRLVIEVGAGCSIRKIFAENAARWGGTQSTVVAPVLSAGATGFTVQSGGAAMSNTTGWMNSASAVTLATGGAYEMTVSGLTAGIPGPIVTLNKNQAAGGSTGKTDSAKSVAYLQVNADGTVSSGNPWSTFAPSSVALGAGGGIAFVIDPSMPYGRLLISPDGGRWRSATTATSGASPAGTATDLYLGADAPAGASGTLANIRRYTR